MVSIMDTSIVMATQPSSQLHFGLIASKDYLPDLNVLGGYIYEAFEELEAVLQSPDMGTSLLEAKRQHKRSETLS